MNKQELREKLRAQGIREDAYDLEGGHLPETFTLGGVNGAWFVYYSERGEETGRKDFRTESEACEYFLELLKRDPSTRL